jgi:hypothetical protein
VHAWRCSSYLTNNAGPFEIPEFDEKNQSVPGTHSTSLARYRIFEMPTFSDAFSGDIGSVVCVQSLRQKSTVTEYSRQKNTVKEFNTQLTSIAYATYQIDVHNLREFHVVIASRASRWIAVLFEALKYNGA